MKIWIRLGAFLICFPFCVRAQETKTSAAIKSIHKIAAAYMPDKPLGFQMNFYYADVTSPDVLIDSLSGACIFSGTNYWYAIDSTETISMSGKSVILFKEDKVMFVNSAASQQNSFSPVAMTRLLDSLLTVSISNITTESNKTQLFFKIDYPGNNAYKSTSFVVDKQTHLIDKIEMVVDSKLLYDAEESQLLSDEVRYGIVTIVYGNYHHPVLPADFFDLSRFYTTDKGVYTAMPLFRQYTIFNGSPSIN